MPRDQRDRMPLAFSEKTLAVLLFLLIVAIVLLALAIVFENWWSYDMSPLPASRDETHQLLRDAVSSAMAT